MRIIISTSGFERVNLKFTNLSEAAIDARPAMEAIALEMMRIIRINFESGGRRGGGSWAKDTPEWQRTKAILNADPRVGFFTGNLFRSVTQPNASNQILEIGPHSVTLGSTLPYADAMQKHRPYMRFLPSDRLRMRQTIRAYFKLAWARGGL